MILKEKNDKRYAQKGLDSAPSPHLPHFPIFPQGRVSQPQPY